MSELRLTTLAQCDSTQLTVRALLEREPHAAHVVRADAQHAGVGRMGRTWENPPGSALLMSIGSRAPCSTDVLDGLVRRVVDLLIARLTHAFQLAPGSLAWDAPNDVVAASSGAKVAGVLIDAVSVAEVVRELCVGIGVNLTGATWSTSGDARAVATIESAAGQPLHTDAALLDRLALEIARDVLSLLDH